MEDKELCENCGHTEESHINVDYANGHEIDGIDGNICPCLRFQPAKETKRATIEDVLEEQLRRETNKVTLPSMEWEEKIAILIEQELIKCSPNGEHAEDCVADEILEVARKEIQKRDALLQEKDAEIARLKKREKG